MAFQGVPVEISLEVLAAPGCFLSAVPPAVQVPKGDPAVFQITAHRTEGYLGPIYLQTMNLVGGHVWDVNPIPAGSDVAILTIDTSGWTPNPGAPFLIGIMPSDVPFPPDEIV
jgi:hypothetical protein